jgi:hypothetical protein
MKRMEHLVRTGVRISVGILAFTLAAGCASTKPQRLPYLVRENLDNAARQLENGNKDEAAALYKVVLLAQSTNTEAQAGLEKAGSSGIDLLTPTMLGVNKSRRPLGGNLGVRIIGYPINRALDLVDCFSFRVGLEYGVMADIHLTRALQALAGGGGGIELGWRERRDLFAGFGTDAGLGLGPFSAEAESITSLGTDGAKARSFTVTGVSAPTDYAYQYYRDYWAVGGRVIAGIVGVGVDFHPVEVVDALAGFLFIDFLHDDLGSTRGLKLTDADLDAAGDLLNIVSNH